MTLCSSCRRNVKTLQHLTRPSIKLHSNDLFLRYGGASSHSSRTFVPQSLVPIFRLINYESFHAHPRFEQTKSLHTPMQNFQATHLFSEHHSPEFPQKLDKIPEGYPFCLVCIFVLGSIPPLLHCTTQTNRKLHVVFPEMLVFLHHYWHKPHYAQSALTPRSGRCLLVPFVKYDRKLYFCTIPRGNSLYTFEQDLLWCLHVWAFDKPVETLKWLSISPGASKHLGLRDRID